MCASVTGGGNKKVLLYLHGMEPRTKIAQNVSLILSSREVLVTSTFLVPTSLPQTFIAFVLQTLRLKSKLPSVIPGAFVSRF